MVRVAQGHRSLACMGKHLRDHNVNQPSSGNGRHSERKQGTIMPKMKTKKSAAKRFQVRGSGSIKRGQAFKRHILTKKTTKNKRQLRGSAAVHETNVASVKAMMPFA
jgi:large subunit ribosomal protein L35